MDKKNPEYKSVFISDVHLGTKSCKAKKLCEFLDSFESENLYLVGDIIDGWALQKRHYWTKSQTEVIRKILKISEKKNVYYIAGNHDEFIRPFFKYDFQIGTVVIADSFDYQSIDGRKILITHGDHFDRTMKIPRWFFIKVCKWIDYLPWVDTSESSFDQKMWDIFGTESTLRKHIKNKYDAALCGHTHQPIIKDDYMNTGDWVLNCTAIVEHLDGKWELISKKSIDKS